MVGYFPENVFGRVWPEFFSTWDAPAKNKNDNILAMAMARIGTFLVILGRNLYILARIAQRKHSSFSPSSPGFESWLRHFSLLLSVWTVKVIELI